MAPEPKPGHDLSYQHPQSGEWAHDIRDPLAEARHAFVRPAWQHRPPPLEGPLRILEVGFGRGLNTAIALAELHAAGWKGEIRAFGIEPHPERCEPWPLRPDELVPYTPWWGEGTGRWPLEPPFSGQVEVAELTAARALQDRWRNPQGFDWIFLDLYSPGKHPGDWERGLYELLARHAAGSAALSSYCCARAVRDGLAAAGFRVSVVEHESRRDSLVALAPPAPPREHNGDGPPYGAPLIAP